MPVLTITPSGKTIDAVEGGTLLDALLAAGEKITSKCGGEAKCGACHVFVRGRPQGRVEDDAARK